MVRNQPNVISSIKMSPAVFSLTTIFLGMFHRKEKKVRMFLNDSVFYENPT